MTVYWMDEEKKRDDDLRKLHDEGNCPCDVRQSERRERLGVVPSGDEEPTEHDLLSGQGLY